MAYIKGEKRDGCIFCEDSIRNENFVLFEGETSYVMINRYPYTSGHLMIIPFRHISKVENLLAKEKVEMFNLLDMAIGALEKAMKPDGFNVGINLGKAAGAGVDDHMHIHIVPRWTGDTNFMCTVGGVRVIPEDVAKTCELLRPHFK
jgi:ATP adenylyltransferase